jgi:hypothetical protein
MLIGRSDLPQFSVPDRPVRGDTSLQIAGFSCRRIVNCKHALKCGDLFGAIHLICQALQNTDRIFWCGAVGGLI